MPQHSPTILTISGADSSGSAGIAADIRAITALGGHAAFAITALTAQNSTGVTAIEPVSPDFVAGQITAALDDGNVKAIKTGMLHRAEIVETIADILEKSPDIPLVIDPVLASNSGTQLLDTNGKNAMISRLFPLATLITPNIPEAEILLNTSCTDMQAAVQSLLTLNCKGVLLKGGHAPEGSTITDIYADATTAQIYESPRINIPNVRGTGCALASAIATDLAQGQNVQKAIQTGRTYIQKIITRAASGC